MPPEFSPLTSQGGGPAQPAGLREAGAIRRSNYGRVCPLVTVLRRVVVGGAGVMQADVNGHMRFPVPMASPRWGAVYEPQINSAFPVCRLFVRQITPLLADLTTTEQIATTLDSTRTGKPGDVQFRFSPQGWRGKSDKAYGRYRGIEARQPQRKPASASSK